MTVTNSQPIVLLVNDDPFQLHLTGSILTRDGYEVIPCLGAEEALQRLSQRGSADVIITDLYMPGIDGWRLCRLLRSAAYQKFNTIPILVVSATFSGADAEELTAQLGADGFLSAPYEARVLRKVVGDLLGNRKPKAPTNVLIVEPDLAVAAILTDTFKANGYEVQHALDGADGLRRFRANPPQMVVLNDDLPDMRGARLLRAIKEPAATTVIIVVTSDPSAEHALELIRSGADNYAPKPVLPDYLLHLCQTAMRQRALLRVEELLELRTRKLQHSEERYRNLFENADVGLVTHTLEGTVIAVNQSFETLSGRAREDVVGKLYSQFLTPAAYEDAEKRQSRARTKKLPSWSHEVAVARPDGSVVVAEARCVYLAGSGQQPGLIMAMYRDLTAEKKLQQQRAEFSAMLAHDIRNPVGLILSCISLLVDENYEPEPELVRKCHRRIMDDARLLQSLVNNYLDVSTIEAGQLKLTKQLVNLSDLLRNIVQRFGWESDARAISLQVVAQDGPGVEGDVLLLERVFGNLLQNALKFTPDGGSISVRVEPRQGESLVSIRNSGPGIDPEKFSFLFQKFQRLDNTEHREGLGLGLYIVKELVEAHGGRVEVNSTLGEGNCFSVFLPLSGVAAKGSKESMGFVMQAK